MKSHIGKVVTCCLLALGTQSLSSEAFELHSQAYQAEYKLTGTTGTSTHLMAFDGNGLGRSEMINSAGSRNIAIIDYLKRKVTVLMPANKAAMTIPLTDDYLSAMGSLSNKMKESAKPLGMRTIQGHPCTGTRYSLEGGGVQEIWNGNDIGGVRVYSKVTAPGLGVSEASLEKFKASAPPASTFAVPAGYSVN